MKNIFWFIFSVLLIGWFLFVLQLAWLANFKFFAPKYEDAKRTVFENSQSYVEWTKQELYKYMEEYYSLEEWEQKDAMRSIILHKSSNINKDLLDYDLRVFVESI